MSENEILNATIRFVKNELKDAEGGHDRWHIERVVNNARLISRSEPVNHFIVELASLLHDIADAKFYDGDEDAGPLKRELFLRVFRLKKKPLPMLKKL